jgi:Large ribosomal RNA subunit accumulation protein YceD
VSTMEKTGSPNPGRLWSVPVAVENIPAAGLHIEIDAPAATRAQLLQLVAGLAAVRDLMSLSAMFDLTRRGAGVHVTGHVSAHVGQNCVVTLELIENDVEEAVDLLFAPAPAEGTQIGSEFDGNAPKDGQEPAEPLIGGTVDLGAIATEFLVLGVDTYPRKPGAEFAPLKVEDDGTHPFSALEALKKRFGGGQS